MDLNDALGWASERKNAVMITIRKDGRPQSSDVAYAVVDDELWVSLTTGRAKTANMKRDPRIVMHISEPSSWSYVSFDGVVELTPPTLAADDDSANMLVDYYERVAGQAHPDWDEYRQAMIDEGRLIARFQPTSVVGQIH